MANKIKDKKALEAILTLAMTENDKMTDEEVIDFFKKKPDLTEEELNVINSWGTKIVDDIIKNKN